MKFAPGSGGGGLVVVADAQKLCVVIFCDVKAVQRAN